MSICVCTYEEVCVTQEDVGGCGGRNSTLEDRYGEKARLWLIQELLLFSPHQVSLIQGVVTERNEDQRCQVTLNNGNPTQGTFLLQWGEGAQDILSTKNPRSNYRCVSTQAKLLWVWKTEHKGRLRRYWGPSPETSRRKSRERQEASLQLHHLTEQQDAHSWAWHGKRPPLSAYRGDTSPSSTLG